MERRPKKPTKPPRTGEPEPEISSLAEATLVAGAMMARDFWESVGKLPDPDDFDDLDLAALWTAIIAVQKRAPVTKFAVALELREMGHDETAAFAALRIARPDLIRLDETLVAVEALHARRLRRYVSRVCGETLQELERARDVQAVVQRHERAIVDLASQAEGADSIKRGSEVVQEDHERVETGISEIDEVSGGLPAGALTLIAARPGMGKTALATAILRNVARAGGAVKIDSLEMGSMALINRAASMEAYDPRLELNPKYSDYERRHLDGDMLERFETAKAAIRRLPIYWDDKQGKTSAQIRLGGRRVRTMAKQDGFDLRLIIVDHIGKILPDKDRDNRSVELGDISNSLMGLANELKIPVVAMAQLNRGVEGRPDKRPTVADLRESGRLEEDAHTIIMLYRQAYYDALAQGRGEEIDDEKAAQHANVLEADFVKNRGGPMRRVKVFCDIACNAIFDRNIDIGARERPRQEAFL